MTTRKPALGSPTYFRPALGARSSTYSVHSPPPPAGEGQGGGAQQDSCWSPPPQTLPLPKPSPASGRGRAPRSRGRTAGAAVCSPGSPLSRGRTEGVISRDSRRFLTRIFLTTSQLRY